jgi:hypothetical protein
MLLHLRHRLNVSLVVFVLLLQEKAIREHAGKVLEERPLLVASVGSQAKPRSFVSIKLSASEGLNSCTTSKFPPLN